MSSDNANDVKATFGVDETNTWKPWEYSSRIKVAKSVEALKKDLAVKKLSNSTKRNRITTFIASKKSRQEFVPLLGPLINRIHVDPLHLKNNACAKAHRYLLDEVMLVANLSSNIKSFSDVPKSSPFSKYINTLRTKCRLSRLLVGLLSGLTKVGLRAKDSITDLLARTLGHFCMVLRC